MPPDGAARTTAMGLWSHAKEFAVAARHVFKAEKGTPLPAYYLLGHSIELSLKAFLLTVGVPLSRLKSRDFGHDLKALLEEADVRGLQSVNTLTATEAGVVRLLNFDYVAKRFEYRETGLYHLPLPELAQSVADKLVLKLKASCVATIKK